MNPTIAETASWLQGIERQRRQDAQRRAQAIRARLPAAVRMLRDRHGVGRIWLFGSLATGEVHAESDLDLAVEGLADDAYFQALGDLSRLLPCAIDLIRMEEAPQTLASRILDEGEAL